MVEVPTAFRNRLYMVGFRDRIHPYDAISYEKARALQETLDRFDHYPSSVGFFLAIAARDKSNEDREVHEASAAITHVTDLPTQRALHQSLSRDIVA